MKRKTERYAFYGSVAFAVHRGESGIDLFVHIFFQWQRPIGDFFITDFKDLLFVFSKHCSLLHTIHLLLYG